MSSLSLLRGSLAAAVLVSAVAGCTRGGNRPAERPVARREATLDGDKWARRNIALLRRSLDRPDRDEMSSRTAAFGFSLGFNPLLMRDPYAADVARLVEAYQKTPARQIKSFDRHLALLRMPEPQRLRHPPLEEPEEDDDGRPVAGPPRPPMPLDLADRENAGSTMAGIAVELQALGEERRAEKVLLDALGRIEGVDFGLGGSHDVVAAAVKMGRLDLLDKLYAEGDPGTRLLLCLVASRAAVQGSGEDN